MSAPLLVEPPLELSLFHDSEKRPLVVERPGPDVPDATDASSRVENCRSLLSSRCSAHFFLEAIGWGSPLSGDAVRGARRCASRCWRGVELWRDEGGSSRIKLGPQVASSHLDSMGSVGVTLPPFFFSLNLRENCLNPKLTFFPPLVLLIKGSGTADLHLLVCSHTPLLLPPGADGRTGGRTDGAEQRTRRR